MVEKSTLDSCLRGTSFPADGTTIVAAASGNGCPPDVLSQVAAIPSRTFGSEEELLCRLGATESCHLG